MELHKLVESLKKKWFFFRQCVSYCILNISDQVICTFYESKIFSQQSPLHFFSLCQLVIKNEEMLCISTDLVCRDNRRS